MSCQQVSRFPDDPYIFTESSTPHFDASKFIAKPLKVQHQVNGGCSPFLVSHFPPPSRVRNGISLHTNGSGYQKVVRPEQSSVSVLTSGQCARYRAPTRVQLQPAVAAVARQPNTGSLSKLVNLQHSVIATTTAPSVVSTSSVVKLSNQFQTINPISSTAVTVQTTSVVHESTAPVGAQSAAAAASVTAVVPKKPLVHHISNSTVTKKCGGIATFRTPKVNGKLSEQAKKPKSGAVQKFGTKSQPLQNRKKPNQSPYHEVLQRIDTRRTAPSAFSNSPSCRVAPTLHKSTSSTSHAPDTFGFNYDELDGTIPELFELAACTQNWWCGYPRETFSSTADSREQRLYEKRSYLRRQAAQNSAAQRFRTATEYRRRLATVATALKNSKSKDEVWIAKKCCLSTCSNESLALTAYCYLHITHNSDQLLFHLCTAKFADNSQCRVPVFDISHELPLCPEHAWKRDNYNRLVQEHKPRKFQRKKPKPSAMTRPPKRNKKKRKPMLTPTEDVLSNTIAASTTAAALASDEDNFHQYIMMAGDGRKHHTDRQLISDMDRTLNDHLNGVKSQHHLHHIMHDGDGMDDVDSMLSSTQELLNICDNSSTYESSEDTGVGGLSESELIGAHDVIEEIPLSDTRLLEEHDLTNVLNQLPEGAFNELFTTVQQNGPFEPTQEEQEDLERALEAVDEQVKSLEQMTGGPDFLSDFLDVGHQILDDSDICIEVLTSGHHSTDLRGLVHT